MVDWGRYLACDQCGALMNQPCRSRTSGGPEALPPIELDHPHAGRKMSGEVVRKASARSATTTANPVRRAARRKATTAASWQALADAQNRRRAG